MDNFPITIGAGRLIATDVVTYSGDTADVQLVRLVAVAGAEGAKTVIDLPGDATYGFSVDVTRLPEAATSTPSSVTDSATSVAILTANQSRKQALVFNDSNNILYLVLGAGPASTTSFTVKIFPNGYYEAPTRFTGAIAGIWTGSGFGSGAARVTELT